MMRIIVIFAFGALLAACSGSSRLEEIFRANAPRHSTAQSPKNPLDNRSTPDLEPARVNPVTPEAPPQEPAKPQSASEE
jgi:hypothetical protein